MATQQIKTKVPLNYLSHSPDWATEMPYEMWTMTVPEGLPRSNVRFQLQNDCEVIDIRSLPDGSKPVLDVHGFEVFHCPFPGLDQLSSIDNIGQDTNKQQAMRSYLSFMTEKLKEQYNGTKAICFDWRVCYQKIPFPYNILTVLQKREKMLFLAGNRANRRVRLTKKLTKHKEHGNCLIQKKPPTGLVVMRDHTHTKRS